MSLKIKKGFLFCIGLAFSFGSSARAESSLNIASEVFIPGLNLILSFSPHMEPTVQEFKKGKELVLAAVHTIEAQGWMMTTQRLEVGLTGAKMAGGNVVSESGKLYVSSLSTASEVESGLMEFSIMVTEDPSFRFFAHGTPSVSEFMKAKQLVLDAMNRINTETGMQLASPRQEVGLTGKRMAGGNAVIEDNKLYVSSTATPEEVERKLIMLCR